MTSHPQLSRIAAQARAAALWARDTGLGGFGFFLVLVVALAGWSASFLGLHKFGLDHMSLSDRAAWLVPLTFDGAPAGLSIVVMRASTHGRSATLWRLLIIAFTCLSSWINYEHIDDELGRYVASFMPPAAVILFEGLMSEARHAAKRRFGDTMARVHPLRWFFDRAGTLDLYRRHILGLPLPAEMCAATAIPSKAASAAVASAVPATARRASASATPAPLPAATTASASPAATASAASPAETATATPDSVYLPAATPGTAATASPRANAATANASTAEPAANPKAASTEQRDLDDVADTFRTLRNELGRSPSDQALATRLGVGRSRAQQLRTAAIKAGHHDLEKPLRAAS